MFQLQMSDAAYEKLREMYFSDFEHLMGWLTCSKLSVIVRRQRKSFHRLVSIPLFNQLHGQINIDFYKVVTQPEYDMFSCYHALSDLPVGMSTPWRCDVQRLRKRTADMAKLRKDVTDRDEEIAKLKERNQFLEERIKGLQKNGGGMPPPQLSRSGPSFFTVPPTPPTSPSMEEGGGGPFRKSIAM